MANRIPAARRREIERKATEIRLDGIRRGLATEEIVDRMLRALGPELFPLEAWRLANGWSRAEVSARLDSLYERDGLAPPGIDAATLCRWEHGERRPSEERIDYLCRLYRTRPDRLGYGTDHTPGEVGHLQRAGIIDAYPHTTEESEHDLISRIRNARERINMFGLTRNFYAREDVLPVFAEKAAAGVPVQLFIMDPYCDSRRDRYRIEPAEAAMEDPDRYVREVLRPLSAAAARHERLRIFLYNFPCSFAIEEIDDVCRVMLYGHGKRGTQGPIVTFAEGSSSHAYFVDQIRWLERLSQGDTPEPWASKGIRVTPLNVDALSPRL
ncbi:helix-turn-helix domain-containing protein [Actinomadura rubrobrunea]|nr:helix-turn-helix transcriptional regulator [Actinomadura rubrobrunea]